MSVICILVSYNIKLSLLFIPIKDNFLQWILEFLDEQTMKLETKSLRTNNYNLAYNYVVYIQYYDIVFKIWLLILKLFNPN